MFKLQASEVMLRKAEDKLKGAQRALEDQRYDDCVSDSYFACFQSVLSYMIIKGEAGKKHQLVRQWVNKELALKSLLPIRLSRHFNYLMDCRAEADYSTTKEFIHRQAADILVESADFLDHMKSLIILARNKS